MLTVVFNMKFVLTLKTLIKIITKTNHQQWNLIYFDELTNRNTEIPPDSTIKDCKMF